jgi:hypothetical protein
MIKPTSTSLPDALECLEDAHRSLAEAASILRHQYEYDEVADTVMRLEGELDVLTSNLDKRRPPGIQPAKIKIAQLPDDLVG